MPVQNSAAHPSATESTAAPRRRQRPADRSAARAAWVRPDFEAFDTALEVTAYSARD